MKHFRNEILPCLIFYVLDVFTKSFELGALLLFFIALAGFGVMLFGYLKEEESKWLQLGGRGVAHLATVLMLIIAMAKVCYVGLP